MNLVDMKVKFWDITYQIACKKRQKSLALNRVHEADNNNNSLLAGIALGDVHQSIDGLDTLIQEGKELAVKVAEVYGWKWVENICRQCQVAAEKT
jgi:hypothetical protein